MSSFDLGWVRAQFPALSLEAGGQPAAFFDGPGGTQVPRAVVEAVSESLAFGNANVHGAFETSRRADAAVTAARAAGADLLGCDPGEVVFGPNMTTLTFALARAIGRELQPGDEIVLTALDHDANYSPWKALEERGAVVRTAGFRREDSTLDADELLSLIGPRTRVVAVGFASNAVGSINPVARIVEAARAAGAWSFVDAVHYAPHGPVDVRALGCDFLACSAYKFFGPHQGLLYGRRELLERLRPYKVRPATERAPERWETGTQNHEAMAGVAAAIDYLAEVGVRAGADAAAPRRAKLLAAMGAIRDRERGLCERLVAGLLAIPGLEFYGIREPERFSERAPTVSIRLKGESPRHTAERLAAEGLFVWDGNYYAMNWSERMGLEPGGAVRIGLAHYNTDEEIDRLLAALASSSPGSR